MGIRLDKNLRLIEIVSIIGVLFAAFLLQYSDSILQDHQNKIQVKLLNLSGDREIINFWHAEKIHTNILKILHQMGAEIISPTEDVILKSVFPEQISLMKGLKDGKITSAEYLNEYSDFSTKRISGMEEIYREELEEYDRLVLSNPRIFNIDVLLIKQVVFYAQIISIIILLMCNTILYKRIGNKYITKIEQENKNLKNKINNLQNQIKK